MVKDDNLVPVGWDCASLPILLFYGRLWTRFAPDRLILELRRLQFLTQPPLDDRFQTRAIEIRIEELEGLGGEGRITNIFGDAMMLLQRDFPRHIIIGLGLGTKRNLLAIDGDSNLDGRIIIARIESRLISANLQRRFGQGR